MPVVSTPVLVGVIVVVLVGVILATSYVKSPPDVAYIISGLTKRVVIGRATIRIPFFERLDRVNLRLIQIDVKTQSPVPTKDYINISVDATVNVKVDTTPEGIRIAAENFLNQGSDYIGAVACEVLEGNVREIVGRMGLQEMVTDRQKFCELVKENVEPDLKAMGLSIVSFNVQNFEDKNGIIEDLGIDNVSQIQKSAAIAKTQAQKEIAIEAAKADKEANDARVEAEREIALRNNQLEIEKARLKTEADKLKAEADMAYEIQRESQRKSLEIESAEANIAKAEHNVRLKEQEAVVREKQLQADIRKTAEATRYEIEQRSEAELFCRNNEAEAQKVEIAKQAEAKRIMAEAELDVKLKEAKAIREIGKAEADAIREKALAEADGMKQRAEAYREYGQAAVTEMIIDKLPSIAESVAGPLSQIDKISIIGGGDGVGQLAGNVPTVMAKTFECVKETTGFDMTEVLKGQTYDAKVNKNIKVEGIDDEESLQAIATIVGSK